MSLSRGHEAEDTALCYLKKNGLDLLARNFRCRFGEIDLVMIDRECLVFVEVRYRAANRFADAKSSVDGRKQQRIALTAEAFLARHPQMAEHPVRFDVVALDGGGRDNDRLEWLRDAFRL
jgi:putative endonuclease